MINLFKRLWRGRRITGLVTAIIAGLIIVAVTGITVLDVVRQRAIFEHQLEEKGLALSRTLNDVLANSLYFRDIEKLRHLADVARAQPEIVSLTIFAPDGRVLVGAEKFPSASMPAGIVTAVHQQAGPEIRFRADYVEVVTPVLVSGDMIGGIRLRFDNASIQNEIKATILQHVWQGGLVMLFGIGLSYLLAQSIVRPVREMVGITDRIATGDFEFSLEQDRSDEIGDLARALEKMTERLQATERERAEIQTRRFREANEQLQSEVAERRRAQLASEKSSKELASAMAELRQTQDTLVQQERLRAVGQMTSGIAHDINNRLQVILGMSDEMLAAPGDLPEGQNRLKMIRESAQDAAKVINLLRDFYRPRIPFEGFEQMAIADIVNGAIRLTEPRWKDQALRLGIDLEVETELVEMPKIEGSPAELRVALINLLFNAVDALPRGGKIKVCGFADEGDVVVEVADSGVGMSEEVRRRCMEPFFTTKGERGSGLGMAMVYRTVQRHDGQLEIDSKVGGGTAVRMRLPVRIAVAATPAQIGADTTTEALEILVADDEPMVQKIIASFLERDGHRVTTANDGTEGLHKFRGGHFDLAIVDRAMPGMNGDELAFNLQRLAPDVPVIMLTGFGRLMSATGDTPTGVDMTLGKPVSHAELSAAVAKVFDMRRRTVGEADTAAAGDTVGGGFSRS